MERKRAQWQEPKPEPWLAEAVEQAVRSRLPLRPDPKSYHDYDALADDYTASVHFLRTATEDVRRFIDGLVEVNNTYTSSGPENASLRRAFWEDYYGEMAKQAMSSLMPPGVILSAELEGMLVEIAAMQLCERLDRMVERFGKGVADTFAELQSAELIGRVDWTVPTACDSFYYEDTVLHEYLGKEIVEAAPPVDVGMDYEQMVRRVQQEVKTISKDRHVVRHGLHFKVIGKAKKSSIGDFPLVIPIDVRRFLETIPIWLRELTVLVRGKSRTDNVVARDIFVEQRELATRELHKWKVPDFCPLVTVGNYVLTGWGAEEATVEKARTSYGWLYVLAIVLAALAAISMGLARLGYPLLSYAAPVAATLSLAAFIGACRQRAVAREEDLGMGGLLAGGLAWFLLASGLMVLATGVAATSWVLGGAGAVLSAVGGELLRRSIRVIWRKK